MWQSLSLSYFWLQVDFAKRAGGLAQMPFRQAALTYTSYVESCVALGCKWDDGFGYATPTATVARRYHEFHHDVRPGSGQERFGCFAYDYDACRRTARVLFAAHPGCLGNAESSVRSSELRSLVAAAISRHAALERIVGQSWLYNVPAYKRLFPLSYVASATVVNGWFRSGALWSQVRTPDGGVRRGVARAVLTAVECIKTPYGLDQCFPYRVLAPSASIADFLEHFGL